MTYEQRYWWRIALELKLRQCGGQAFQDFFSAVMAKAHKDDFVRVKPQGKLGDQGCDGYLLTTGRVFQCYGAENGAAGKVSTLTSKMAEDYAKAAKGVPGIMNEWHMAHNLMGVPTKAVEALNGLKLAHPKITFGMIGPPAIEQIVLDLDPADIEDLLGPAATAKDAEEMQSSVLKALVTAITGDTVSTTINEDVRPVPVNKIEKNKLARHWAMFIAGGWQNAAAVEDYFDNHPDPMTGAIVALRFKEKYADLRIQGLSPDDIMTHLLEMIVGRSFSAPPVQVAAQALLAYLFEKCDIFERETLVPAP